MRWPIAASSCSRSARGGCAPKWAAPTPRWRRKTPSKACYARPARCRPRTAAASSAPTAKTSPGSGSAGECHRRHLPPESFLDGERVHDLAVDVVRGVLQAAAVDIDHLVGRRVGEAPGHVRGILLLVHLGTGHGEDI